MPRLSLTRAVQVARNIKGPNPPKTGTLSTESTVIGPFSLVLPPNSNFPFSPVLIPALPV